MVPRKKFILSALCMTACLLATPMPTAFAADTTMHDDAIVSPCMEYISQSTCDVIVNGTTATVIASVRGNSSLTTKCQITLKLQQKSGTNWTTIQTWTSSGNNYRLSISKTTTITKGNSYRAVATVTVWSGSKSETMIRYSAVKTA